MIVVDANILIYAANRDAPEASRALELLEGYGNGDEPWYLTWGVIYEFFRVVTHRTIRRPLTASEGWNFLSDFMAAPTLSILEPTARHFDVLREVIDEVPDLSGNLMFDLRTAVLMREHGIRRIVTHDGDFARFPFLEVVDPLA